MSTSSALRLPLLFTGVSSPDFSDTERRPGSLAVRGVRGTRCGVDGAALSMTGNTAVDGPAPPFCFGEEEDKDENALWADWRLACEARLLRVLVGVPACDAGPRVPLDRLVSVSLAFWDSAIQLFSAGSKKGEMV